MRRYETGFVLSPTLSEEETEQFIQQMAEVVSQKKGEMVKQDLWGKRKLAYPIDKFEEGFYVFFVYEGESDISQELERLFKQTDSVLRFLTVKKNPRDLAPKKKKSKREEPPAEAEQTETGEPTPKQEKEAD